MYKLCFYVPGSHVESVKDAVFAAGGGRIGNYEACCWQVFGEGQFRPCAGSNPFLGKIGELERVAEWKVELVVTDDYVKQAVEALRKAHPYETPAYEVWQLASF